MEIDKNKCVGCGNCIPWCTMGAIYIGADGRAEVNADECVECDNCYRVMRPEGFPPGIVRLVRKALALVSLSFNQPIDRCPAGAHVPPKLEWPRTLRRAFSDPVAPHALTGVSGRGTEEIKTNDVTGRLGPGDVGFVVELGRPGIGARFRDFERVAMALAPLGVNFEPQNPLTALMTDTSTGKFREDVLDEKVMSAIIEIKTTSDNIAPVLSAVDRVQRDLPTVLSLGIASRCEPDGTIPHQALVEQLGYRVSYNGKTNLGFGRPHQQATSAKSELAIGGRA